MTICLRLVKDETACKNGETIKFANRTYALFIDSFLQCANLEEVVRNEFCEKYLNSYYDLQLYFLQHAAYFLPHAVLTHRKTLQNNASVTVHQNLQVILSALIPILPSEDTTPEMFTSLPLKTSLLNPTTYKVAFQSVWLGHLRHPLDQKQLKDLLLVIHKRIIPYMNNPQRLMDWLTDSYNSGTPLYPKSD
jgi:U3 small nucleolar RNA-associated protein 19